MRQTMKANWNRFKTFARQQRARLADALEILGGRRPRGPAQPIRTEARMPAEPRE